MKRAIYPFWQSMFHYNEWVDDNETKKLMKREKLKERILIAIDKIPMNESFKYEKKEVLLNFLQSNFPFGKNHFYLSLLNYII